MGVWAGEVNDGTEPTPITMYASSKKKILMFWLWVEKTQAQAWNLPTSMIHMAI
jgi:hypothetical protein